MTKKTTRAREWKCECECDRDERGLFAQRKRFQNFSECPSFIILEIEMVFACIGKEVDVVDRSGLALVRM